MEPMENLYLENGMSALAIMKKIEKWLPFHKCAGLPHELPICSFTLPDIRQIQQKETLRKITDLSRK